MEKVCNLLVADSQLAAIVVGISWSNLPFYRVLFILVDNSSIQLGCYLSGIGKVGNKSVSRFSVIEVAVLLRFLC